MKYVDKGWKRLKDVWKKANVCWHMGAPLKESPVVVIASVKTADVWQSVAFGLTGDAHSRKLDEALCKNRDVVKDFTPSQVKSVVPGTLAWLNLNRVVWSVFTGGLMNEKTDRFITPPAVVNDPEPDDRDWEKEALDALNFGIAQGQMLLGMSEKHLKSLKPSPVEPPEAAKDIINTNVAPVDKMHQVMELAAQFVDGTEIPKFCVVDCKKRPSDNNCAHCPFFCNRPVGAGHFNALMYPKGVKALRLRNNPYWENDVITEERLARVDKLDTYEDSHIAKFCVVDCAKRARADVCGKCKYCTCAAGEEKEFAAQIRKARLLVK